MLIKNKTMKLKRFFYVSAIIGLAFFTIRCTNTPKEEEVETTDSSKVELVSIEQSVYGTMPTGEEIQQFKLKNQTGIEVDIITYGGIITSLKTPNKEGVSEDIVLGYDSLSQYIEKTPYFGAIIGRYGNRIAKGKFSLDGTEYTLETNDNTNHLHGGVKGYDKVVWAAEAFKTDSTASLKLSYLSKDMEGGYPGNLQVVVIYTLTSDNKLEVAYEATTDKKTIVNLTQHSYFNLSADFTKPILDHELMIDADKMVPVDKTLIPTGKLADVTNTPFDFRTSKLIGNEVDAKHEQIVRGLGYDHCWVINNTDGAEKKVASLYYPANGRLLEVYTEQPGIQLYTGNFLDGTLPKKGGEGTYAHRTGLCLETQHFPDSPNQKDFPSVVLNPGEKYLSKTIFAFSVK